MYRYDTTTTGMSTPEIFGDSIEYVREGDLTGSRVRLSKDSKRLAVLSSNAGGVIRVFELNGAKDGYVQSGENIVGDEASSIASSDIIVGGRIGPSIDISGDDIVFGTTANQNEGFYRIYGKTSANSNADTEDDYYDDQGGSNADIEDDDQGGDSNLKGSGAGDEDYPPRNGSPGFFTGMFITLAIFVTAFCILKIAEKKGYVELSGINMIARSHDHHATPVGTKDYQDDMEMRRIS